MAVVRIESVYLRQNMIGIWTWGRCSTNVSHQTLLIVLLRGMMTLDLVLGWGLNLFLVILGFILCFQTTFCISYAFSALDITFIL